MKYNTQGRKPVETLPDWLSLWLIFVFYIMEKDDKISNSNLCGTSGLVYNGK